MMQLIGSFLAVSLLAASLALVGCNDLRDPMYPDGKPHDRGPVQENPAYGGTELQRELQDDVSDPDDAWLQFEEGWGGEDVTETAP